MSPDCFRAKIDASVKKTLETKPQLVQISAAWNSPRSAIVRSEAEAGSAGIWVQGKRGSPSAPASSM